MSNYFNTTGYFTNTYWTVPYWTKYGAEPPEVAPQAGQLAFNPDTVSGTTYALWLATPSGTRIKLLDRFIRLQCVLGVNAVDVATVDLPASFPLMTYIQEDTRLEIWRQVPGGRKYLYGDTVFFIRDWDQILDDEGRESTRFLAFGADELLDRRIIAYDAGSAQASKNDYVTDMMKAIVRENLGASATDSDRDISTYLSVESDYSDGPQTSKSFSRRNVMTTLRELAQEADDQSEPVFFGVTYDGNGLNFVTRTDQWGVDRSTAGGRVVLSASNGTLSSIKRGYVSSDERNYIYAGGRGREENRTIYEQAASGRPGVSPFNRRELFVNVPNAESSAKLESEAGAAIRQFRPRETFEAQIRSTRAVQYGREYSLGDKLLSEYRGEPRTVRLDSVEVVQERGLESLRGNLRVT